MLKVGCGWATSDGGAEQPERALQCDRPRAFWGRRRKGNDFQEKPAGVASRRVGQGAHREKAVLLTSLLGVCMGG